jgi:lipoate-protein ligase A
MAYDEAAARQLVSEAGAPLLRCYGWDPPAISFGWNQSLDEIDVKRAAEAGIDIVRRPTGGRAILHSEELTYSVVMRVRRRNILAVYDDISRALVRGLELVGADVAIERTQPHFPSLYRSASAVACFSSSARFEVKHHGRKLVGSAQRRYAVPDGSEVVLQHGSVLLGPGHLRMTEFLVCASEEQRAALRSDLCGKTTDLSAVLGRRVTFDEVAFAIRRGFEDCWNLTFLDRPVGQPMEIPE